MSNESHDMLVELLEAWRTETPVALATIVRARGSVPRHVGTKMLVYENGRTSGTIGGGEMESRVIEEALQALQTRRARVIPYALVEPERGDPGVCGGELEVYVEPYLPPATVFVIGCGHVGQAVADLAHWMGFRVVVHDDRAELASPETIPHADVYLPGAIEDALAQHPMTRNTYVVLVTRNALVDREILPHLLDAPAPYIGVMGSKRRWAHTQNLLRDQGLDDAQLAKFHSPIGLELNAETPEEIAVSIMAEIVMARRGGTGERMAG